MLDIGLLSGGYGGEELERVGAFRICRNTADLWWLLDELGVVPEDMSTTVDDQAFPRTNLNMREEAMGKLA